MAPTPHCGAAAASVTGKRRSRDGPRSRTARFRSCCIRSTGSAARRFPTASSSRPRAPPYRDRLTAVSGPRARAAAQRVFKRDALTIVVVGDAKALYDKLKAIAPVRLIDVGGTAMNPADLNPTGGPVAFDRSQIVARSDSFQALVQGNVFGAQSAKAVVDGDSIVYSESTVIGPFQQQSTVVLNGDLSMRRTDQTGLVQGQ